MAGKGLPAFGPGHFGRPRIHPIPRPALLARLDAARGMVVLLAAPGAGKSTLLDSWAAARSATVIDSAALWAPVPGPLAVHGAGPGDAPRLAALASRHSVVVAAAEDLDISGAEVITARELAFAEDETYQVLAGALADAEAADALAPDLHLLTHGWPALVALAGAWLAQFPARERLDRLRALARVEENLTGYLVPAVIAALPRPDRELLRRLVHLPALDARLADQLDVTEDLGAIVPFVQPLARRPGWFVVPASWRAAIARELPLPAGEVAALQSGYRAAVAGNS